MSYDPCDEFPSNLVELNEKVLYGLTLGGTTFIGLFFLSWWFFYNPIKVFVLLAAL